MSLGGWLAGRVAAGTRRITRSGEVVVGWGVSNRDEPDVPDGTPLISMTFQQGATRNHDVVLYLTKDGALDLGRKLLSEASQ